MEKIEQSFSKNHLSPIHHNDINSVLTLQTSENICSDIANTTTTSMTEVQSFYTRVNSFCLNYRTFIRVVKIILFIGLSMTVGILTVCFTATQKSNQTCGLILRSISTTPMSKNSYPKAVVAYDFNNDSKLDIAVTNSGTDNIGIFLGQGDGNLSSQVTYSTGTDSQPSSLAIGDFNNDRQMDIVVANFGAHNIGILLGNGNGTFTDQITIPTRSSRPLWVNVGDFNNDSRLDIVTVNYGTNSINVLLGYGNGNFTTQIILSAPYDSTPFSAVIGDFNNDDALDIAVANYGTHNIAIYLGDGNGTFSIPIISSTGIESQPYAIAAVDFNNDSKLDIVVTNYGTGSISVLFGYGNGTCIIQGTYSTGDNSKPVSVIIGNFNSDTRLDIVVSNSRTNNVGIFLGYPNGTFANQNSFSTGLDSEPHFVAGGDFNHDGLIDIVVVNYKTNAVNILIAHAETTFSSQTVYSTDLQSNPTSVGIGDFNNDSLLDIVVANPDSSSIDVLFGNGDGTFPSPTTYSTGPRTNPFMIIVDDFNNDNIVDIAVLNYISYFGAVKIFLGNYTGLLSSVSKNDVLITYIPISFAVGDFNADGRLDLVIIFYPSIFKGDARTIEILLGNGDGSFSNTKSFLYHSRLSPESVAVADFNNDAQLDLAIANQKDPTTSYSNIGILLGNGNGTFSDQKTFSTGYYSLTQSVTVGDFNNDSQLDIVVANPWNSNIGILLGYGNGTFSTETTYSTGINSNPIFVTTHDSNNDNRLDILAVNNDINTVTFFLGNGDGTFSNQMSYSTGNGSSPSSAAFGDFNRDSIIDVVIANSGNKNVGVMLGIVTVNYASTNTFSTGSTPGPNYVVVNDFNNDNQLDIAVVNHITNNVGVFSADKNGSFPIEILYTTGPFSSPTSITVTDLNNDMQLDMIVTNSGTNDIKVFFGYENGSFENPTTYSLADDSDPQSIASGDFNNDSRPDIIVANYGTDTIDILLSSSSGRFQTETPYSTGTASNPCAMVVGDINNDRILDVVVANNGKGNVGIFIGTGDGTFSEQKTYFIANSFFPVAVDVGNFNNDSRLDIVAVDNIAYKIVILLQDENGNFSNSGSYDVGKHSLPLAVAVSDINNDSLLDILVGTYQTNCIYIFKGIGNGTFALFSYFKISQEVGLKSIAIADFNSDSRIDITIVNTLNDHIDILLGNGDGTFSEQKTYLLTTGSLASGIAVADFDKDNCLDLVVSNQNTDNVAVLFGYGNGTFSDQITFSTGTGSQPISVAVGDFNSDGLSDIAVANSQNGNVGILLAFVNRTFFSQIILSTNNRFSLPFFVVVGHFNNDGLLDIAVCNRYSANIGIFLALAENTLLNVPPYSTGLFSQPTYVAVGDFNNDKRLDIAVANYGTNNVMILFGSGYGTILNEMTYTTGDNSQPCWIAIGDLNNDNRLDLVVANSGNDNIGILLGYDNGTFSGQKTYLTGLKSKPTSVIIDDFNGDTQVDIAVANYGSNNVGLFYGYGNGSFASQILFSTSFDSRPFALASGDMNNDNLSDIIIVNNEYGNTQLLMKQC